MLHNLTIDIHNTIGEEIEIGKENIVIYLGNNIILKEEL